MGTPLDTNAYPLGTTDFEQERLVRQAAWVAPHTERLFRRAGIGPGQRVLELGSGVGDVALIVGRLVGDTGEVLGVDREARSLATASARMRELGLSHVRFVQKDVLDLPEHPPFDAGVGRYILMYVKDPAAVLRDVARHVRPGGVIAFLDTSFQSFLDDARDLPLWRDAAQVMTEAFWRNGADTEMGKHLSAAFVGAGFPEPETETYTLTGSERWMSDCLISLQPQIDALGIRREHLGDLRTLQQRLMQELSDRGHPVPLPQMVGAWARITETCKQDQAGPGT
jgi:ubiquinone/menaquinone biosynthesis C-methylase UbiE